MQSDSLAVVGERSGETLLNDRFSYFVINILTAFIKKNRDGSFCLELLTSKTIQKITAVTNENC